MTQTPDQFARKLDRMAVQFGDRAIKELLEGLGRAAAKDDVPDGYKADLGGDLQMRNWPRRSGARQTMDGRYDIKGDTVEITPGKRSRGPIKMLEEGRTPRRAGDVAISILGAGYGAGGAMFGPKIRKRKVKRNVGPMAAKGTWSDAVDVVQRRYPARLREWTTKAIRKGIGG